MGVHRVLHLLREDDTCHMYLQRRTGQTLLLVCGVCMYDPQYSSSSTAVRHGSSIVLLQETCIATHRVLLGLHHRGLVVARTRGSRPPWHMTSRTREATVGGQVRCARLPRVAVARTTGAARTLGAVRGGGQWLLLGAIVDLACWVLVWAGPVLGAIRWL